MWKNGTVDLRKALTTHIPIDQVVVGDPLKFAGAERGWDLESLVVGKPALLEYELDWQNKEITNPATGNRIKVGSLPPKEQEKYRPKAKSSQPDDETGQQKGAQVDEPDVSDKFDAGGDKPKHKVVPGGVVVNKQITPQDYKQRTDNMQQVSFMRSKRWNSEFSIHRDAQGNHHLFMKTFDQAEFDGGATNVERANTIKLIGAFKDADSAKRYVMGGDDKVDLDQKKRVTLAKQTPWGAKEMGIQ